MKLRNKKTGETVEIKMIQVNDKYIEDHEVDLLNGEKLTLKLLADSFDDVKEPLIKDDKIRKALRAWANANGVERVLYMENIYRFSAIDIATSLVVDFGSMIEHSNLEGGFYNIDELCGNEE